MLILLICFFISIFNMKNTIIGLFAFLIIIWSLFIIYQRLSHTYIKAEFKHIDPIPSKMNVYYKGYKLGSTSKLKISNDFKKTYLYITLNQRGLHLPKNISVEIKDYDRETKYVEIIYPRSPQLRYIKTGDVIHGKLAYSPNELSQINQVHINNLSEKGEDLLSSAKNTSDSLTKMVNLLTEVLNENRLNIYQITTNLKDTTYTLSLTSSNLESLTSRMDKELTSEMLRNSSSNIETITDNLAKSSANLYQISGSFINSSSALDNLISKTDSLVESAKTVLCKLYIIIEAITQTLGKRFGGARMLFKQPLK